MHYLWSYFPPCLISYMKLFSGKRHRIGNKTLQNVTTTIVIFYSSLIIFSLIMNHVNFVIWYLNICSFHGLGQNRKVLTQDWDVDPQLLFTVFKLWAEKITAFSSDFVKMHCFTAPTQLRRKSLTFLLENIYVMFEGVCLGCTSFLIIKFIFDMIALNLHMLIQM